jgi:hypothetical protein
LLLVATIFGAFSVSGVIALLVADKRGHLFHFFFLLLTFASLAFIFATALDAIMLPGMKKSDTAYQPEQLRGLLDLGEVVIWAVLLGTLALAVAIAAFGFAFSRATGLVVAAMSVLTVGLFVWYAWYLAALLG